MAEVTVVEALEGEVTEEAASVERAQLEGVGEAVARTRECLAVKKGPKGWVVAAAVEVMAVAAGVEGVTAVAAVVVVTEVVCLDVVMVAAAWLKAPVEVLRALARAVKMQVEAESEALVVVEKVGAAVVAVVKEVAGVAAAVAGGCQARQEVLSVERLGADVRAGEVAEQEAVVTVAVGEGGVVREAVAMDLEAFAGTAVEKGKGEAPEVEGLAGQEAQLVVGSPEGGGTGRAHTEVVATVEVE